MDNERGADMNDLKNTLTKVQEQEKSNKSKKRLVGGHFTKETQQQIRIIAASQDMTIQALLTEAINDLFEKHSYPRIAQ